MNRSDTNNDPIKIKPMGARVLLRRDTAEDVTPGGIIVPDKAKEKPARGEVLAVGPGRMLDSGLLYAPPVTVGEVVWFRSYSGTEIRIDGETLVIVGEDDIIAAGCP